MMALSIRQPWAWLIVRPDVTDPLKRLELYQKRLIKDVENRNWRTKFRGEFLIHAAKEMTPREYKEAHEFVSDVISEELARMMPHPKDMKFGGIIGKANLVACIEPHHVARIPWHLDWCHGFQLENSTPLKFVPCRGMPGFFNVDELNAAPEVRR